MLRTYANPFAADPDLIAACQAQGVNLGAAAAFLANLSEAQRDGFRAWINDPANSGANWSDWRAAFPRLGNLSGAQVRALMLFFAAKTPAVVVDDGALEPEG